MRRFITHHGVEILFVAALIGFFGFLGRGYIFIDAHGIPLEELELAKKRICPACGGQLQLRGTQRGIEMICSRCTANYGPWPPVGPASRQHFAR